jgi:hypothetical protein
MSPTTNHKFYRALGRLHGPWCKQSQPKCLRGEAENREAYNLVTNLGIEPDNLQVLTRVPYPRGNLD